MANKNASGAVVNFKSQWPSKLKALKTGELLLIPKEELDYSQVSSLVSNMNYRWKGKLRYTFEGAVETDCIVTCVYRGHGIVKDRRILGTKKGQKYTPQPHKPLSVSEANAPPADEAPVIALIEALHNDGRLQTFRIRDKEHYDDVMARTANDLMIIQVQTFALTHTKKRDFSWKDETSPLKG